MTESGFKYFVQFMQERNAPPKPKVNPAPAPLPPPVPETAPKAKPAPWYMALPEVPPAPRAPDDDYTGAVCLLHRLTPLFAVYEEILVDADDLPWLSESEWYVVRVGKYREKRVRRKEDCQYLHRVIMTAPEGMHVDHIKHRPMDNRRRLLRVCTHRDNNLNSRPRRNGTSKYRGVSWQTSSGKWVASAGTRDKRRKVLGYFTDEVEAARAYNEYAKRVYGSMAYLNPV